MKLECDIFVCTKYSGKQLTISNGDFLHKAIWVPKPLWILQPQCDDASCDTSESREVIQLPKQFGALDLTIC